MFRIESEDKDTDARTGLFETGHGVVQTPAFLPVATKGAVKTLDSSDLANLGVDAVIVNAFHLWLRGIEAIEETGGLHTFMNWNRPIFTDSGGFQIIRKDFDFKLKDEGFVLKSPIDGARVLYSPEVCMEVQSKLGSDVAFALDDCPPHPSDKTRIEESVQRTKEWAQQCFDAKGRDQQLFGIAQGGTEPGLREQSALMLADIGFDGYGIGGNHFLHAMRRNVDSANYSTSYIYHLFKEKEMLAYRLLSIHNLCCILALLANAREAIRRNRFLEFKDQFLSEFTA